MGKVVLITGASSGIGKSIALLLYENGYKVYGTSRNPQKINSKDIPFELLKLDVSDEDTIFKAVNYIIQKEKRIDYLINNAGMGIAGPIEETPEDDMQIQMETNYFGMIRVIKSVLPFMRKQKSGMIVNIGSVGGLVSIPFQSFYSSSKYAVEALSEALCNELYPFGIKVCIIEPVDTKTGFTGSRKKSFISENSPYKEKFDVAIKAMERDEMNGDDPNKVAKTVLKVLHKKNPPVRVIVGLKFKLLFTVVKRFLPTRLYMIIMRNYYK